VIDFENPLYTVLQAALDVFPDLDCIVFFADGLEEKLGQAEFPDDGGRPIIQIGMELPIGPSIEILAHELAHVAVGTDCDNDHGPEWESAFARIHAAYCARVASFDNKHSIRFSETEA
jgi:hypothetical protein